jgi:hypothetical protein
MNRRFGGTCHLWPPATRCFFTRLIFGPEDGGDIPEDGNIHNYRCEIFKFYKRREKHKQKNGAVLRVDKNVFLSLR